MPIVTHHARQRMRERRGTKGDADRVTERALTDGISYKDVSGRLHRYLTALHMQAGHEIRIDVDNDIVFVTDQEKDECVFDFDDYGQDFIVKALRFMGCNAQPV